MLSTSNPALLFVTIVVLNQLRRLKATHVGLKPSGAGALEGALSRVPERRKRIRYNVRGA
jgi:hypothetical protein